MTNDHSVGDAFRASVRPFKCDNPDHPKGCPFGYRLIECPEDEAHTWIASIHLNGMVVWSSNQMESQSRKAATAALLNRLDTPKEVT
jgi:hypothetical protein